MRKDWPHSSNLSPEQKVFHKERKNLNWKKGILFWKQRIVHPPEVQKTILEQAHQGHPGIVRMKRLIRETYWWLQMSRQTEDKVKYCIPCQQSKKSRPKTIIPKTSIPVPETTAKQWSLDIMGPFFNGRYLVVAIDDFSNFPELLDTKSITSYTIITFMESLFARYGNPDAVLTDNGPQFISREFRLFLKDLDVHHYTSAVYNPQESGRVESFNKYLKHGIQTFGTTVPWQKGVRNLLKSYRTTPLAPDKPSPAQIFLGHAVRGDVQPNLKEPTRRTLQQTKPMDISQQKPNNMGKKPVKGLYQRGDSVLVKRPFTPKGMSPFQGPRTVKEVLSYYSFLLDDGQVWNARKLKPFRVRQPAPVIFPDATVQQPHPNPQQLRQPPQQPRRQSTRPTRGAPPTRFGHHVVHVLRGDEMACPKEERKYQIEE